MQEYSYIDMGIGSVGGSSIISGTVVDYASLPLASTATNSVYFVTTASGGLLSVLNIYKYPKGLYTSDGSTWILMPLNVKVSEDSTTLINIDNWTEFYNYAFDVNIYDRLIYKGIQYKNVTGSYSTVDPSLDLLNWESENGNSILYYNDLGAIIPAFSVLHLKAGTIFNGKLMPTPDLADASKWELTQGTLAITEKAIGIGEIGYAIKEGRIKGGDTSSLPAGSQLWLSADTPGSITTIKPVFPNYSISLGGNFNQATAPDGEILVSITKDIYDTFNDGWDGAIRETFDFLVTSDGATTIGTLTNQVNPLSDLTLLFSDGFYNLDTTTTPLEVTLVDGTATTLQMNYVFIDIATKTLQTSTIGFPVTEHCKVARIGLFDATRTQLKGAQINQNINDHIKKEGDNGHILHIAERLRASNAEWDSGTAPSLTGTPDDVYISITAGLVWQLHKQEVDSQDMSIGDDIDVVNDPITPYRTTTNLNDITVFSTGDTWNNLWGNLVVWGVANKTGETDHIMVNLPSDGYTSEDIAIEDRNNYANYTIPREFKGTGYLIGRFTIRRSGAIFTYNPSVGFLDLRGFFPNNSAGGGTGSSGVTEFNQLNDTPLSYIDNADKVVTVSSDELSLIFKTTYPEYADNATALAGGLIIGALYRTGDLLKVVH